MAILNPLTQQHCNDIDQVIQTYPHLMDTLRAYEECGLDCQQQKEQLEAQYNICTALKRKFNPLST